MISIFCPPPKKIKIKRLKNKMKRLICFGETISLKKIY